jgi:hypothetical protein
MAIDLDSALSFRPYRSWTPGSPRVQGLANAFQSSKVTLMASVTLLDADKFTSKTREMSTEVVGKRQRITNIV